MSGFLQCSRAQPSSGHDEENRGHDGEGDGKGSNTRKKNRSIPVKRKQNQQNIKSRIEMFRKQRKSLKNRNIVVVKRSKNVVQALNLPKVLNLNPRSAMNKLEELKTFIEEEAIDVAFISESHDREDKRLDEHLHLDNHTIISNIYQREGKGGRPALVINNEKYNVQNLTNTVIQLPWGVEVTWALLTPKVVSNDSIIQNIVLGSIYCKPKSKKKTALLDHIAETYNFLNMKYGKGLHWLLAGDTNDLKLDQILSLSPSLKSVVVTPTRLNPDRILDNMITDLSRWYQTPQCLPALDADPGSGGKPSDHLTVVMEPLSVINNKPARISREVQVRPIKQSGVDLFSFWIRNQNWSEVLSAETVDEKSEILQNLLLSKCNEFLPLKKRKISSDDQPFCTEEMKRIKRSKTREFHKHRRSIKWRELNV